MAPGGGVASDMTSRMHAIRSSFHRAGVLQLTIGYVVTAGVPRGTVRFVESYGGLLGQTRSEHIHYRCPCGMLFPATVNRAVNATRDPQIADALRAGTLLTVECPHCGQSADVQVTVVYHDEEARRFALVLPAARRHRELEERAELLKLLAREGGAALPNYVVNFAV